MRTINLDCLVENELDKKPKVILVNGVPVLEGSLFDNSTNHGDVYDNVHSLGNDRDDKKSYPVQKTEYQVLVEEGHTSFRVTDKELDPFVKGWFKPFSFKRVHTDWESDWHEYFHCKGHGEYDTRTIMRNLLNFYGKRGDYHV